MHSVQRKTPSHAAGEAGGTEPVPGSDEIQEEGFPGEAVPTSPSGRAGWGSEGCSASFTELLLGGS